MSRWVSEFDVQGSRQREQNRQKAVDATTELNEIIRSASLEPAYEPRARLAAGNSGYTEKHSGDLKPLTRLLAGAVIAKINGAASALLGVTSWGAGVWR